jgi:hypothetical protein
MADFTIVAVIFSSLYLGLYLVKARYVLQAANILCSRLQYYDKLELITGSKKKIQFMPPVRLTASVVSLVLAFIFLLFMLYREGTDFFVPYDYDTIDNLAFTMKAAKDE